MIKAIIFDIGGVLAFDVWENLVRDSDYGIASICNLDTELVEPVGKKLWEEFAYRSVSEEFNWHDLEKEYWHRFIDEIGLSVSVDDLIGLTDRFIQPISGMQELVQRLFSRGIKLAICSDNTEFWFQRQFYKLGYNQFFDLDCVMLSNRIGVSKSSPKFEMFQEVVDKLEVDKASCIFVDDRKANIENAIKFDLPALYFPSYTIYGYKYLEVLFREMSLL